MERIPWLWSRITDCDTTPLRVESNVTRLISPVFHAPKNNRPWFADPRPHLEQNTMPVGAMGGV